MAVASAGLYADHLPLTPDRKPCHSIFLQTGCSSNQKCHSTEGNSPSLGQELKKLNNKRKQHKNKMTLIKTDRKIYTNQA